MANLKAYFQFDIDLLNLNRFIDNIESFRLDQDIYDPWEDRYTIFTHDEAIVLHGNGFAYDTSANMYQGTVEAFSQWFYDDQRFAWTEAFLLSDLDVPALEIYNALQSASTGDDFALLEQALSGDDMFNMSHFDDNARGFDGADTMRGHGGDDTLRGDDGNDIILGGSGDDTLIGGQGRDELFGGADSDVLRGGEGNDVLRAGRGDDTLFGNGGADKLFGGRGDDTASGGADDDTLRGRRGDDTLLGNRGADKLFGGADNDVLRGGEGADILRGGIGRDKLFGGTGEDIFKFQTGDGIDIIKDFQVSFLAHDRISLKGLDAVSGWSDLKQNHMQQDGSDVVIDGGNGDMLILEDTSVSSLVGSFFDF